MVEPPNVGFTGVVWDARPTERLAKDLTTGPGAAPMAEAAAAWAKVAAAFGEAVIDYPQIMAVLRQAESGVAVPELCREHGISTASFYKWRSKYGGMDASMMSQMKALEDENRRLKRMFADLSMQADLLKEALGKK